MHGDHLSHWKPCMHAGCSLVLYSIHISLDFSSVDFQGMLEVRDAPCRYQYRADTSLKYSYSDSFFIADTTHRYHYVSSLT